MIRRRTRRIPAALALALLSASVCACVSVEDFFFVGVPAEGYGFDELDPSLDGDLSAPHPSVVPSELREEGFARSEGLLVHWVMARQPRGEARATIVYSHGNGPHLGRFWDRAELLWELGYQVVLYDYPGYGRSEGRASEAGLYAAGQSVLTALASRDDVDPERVVLYGHSLGGAVAFELAARAERGEIVVTRGGTSSRLRAAGLVTESAWCSIEAMVQDGSFLDLPSTLITHLRFDSCARIAELRETPILLLHGERDRVVPPRQLALLVGHARVPPRVERSPSAAHTDVAIAGEPSPGFPIDAGLPAPSEAYVRVLRSFVPP